MILSFYFKVFPQYLFILKKKRKKRLTTDVNPPNSAERSSLIKNDRINCGIHFPGGVGLGLKKETCFTFNSTNAKK